MEKEKEPVPMPSPNMVDRVPGDMPGRDEFMTKQTEADLQLQGELEGHDKGVDHSRRNAEATKRHRRSAKKRLRDEKWKRDRARRAASALELHGSRHVAQSENTIEHPSLGKSMDKKIAVLEARIAELEDRERGDAQGEEIEVFEEGQERGSLDEEVFYDAEDAVRETKEAKESTAENHQEGWMRKIVSQLSLRGPCPRRRIRNNAETNKRRSTEETLEVKRPKHLAKALRTKRKKEEKRNTCDAKRKKRRDLITRELASEIAEGEKRRPKYRERMAFSARKAGHSIIRMQQEVAMRRAGFVQKRVPPPWSWNHRMWKQWIFDKDRNLIEGTRGEMKEAKCGCTRCDWTRLVHGLRNGVQGGVACNPHTCALVRIREQMGRENAEALMKRRDEKEEKARKTPVLE